MVLAKTVAPSFKNLPDRLSRPLTLFSFKSLRSFDTVPSDTKLNLNLELVYFRIFSYYCQTEGKRNLKERGGKLASKSLASVQKSFLKMLAFFLSSKLVTLSFVLKQMFVKGLRVFRDFHNSFGLPMFSVNFVSKN